MLCSRQVGKTLVAAALALKTALLEPPALVLVTAPSIRQSGEFLEVVKQLHRALRAKANMAGQPMPWYQKMLDEAGADEAWLKLPEPARETALQLHLPNGSRILGLPGSEATIRGYSRATLVIVDEASRVKEGLVPSIRPMLAVSGGRLVSLSTPFGRRGWFYEEWDRHERTNPVRQSDWHSSTPTCDLYRIPATMCPRINAEFLAEERRALGERWFNQEYLCSFVDAVGQVFPSELIERAFADQGVEEIDLGF